MQLVEQQRQISSLQQQSAEQQLRLQQEAIGPLQQQAAEAAELREQVAELKGHVAQLMQALQHRE